MTQNKINNAAFRILDALLESRVVVVAAPSGSGVTMTVRRVAQIAAPGAGNAALRAPHHTVSDSGAREELNLAQGVFYLDDAQEFGRRTLGNLSTAIRRRAALGAPTPIWILRADTRENAERVHGFISGYYDAEGNSVTAEWGDGASYEGSGLQPPVFLDLMGGAS